MITAKRNIEIPPLMSLSFEGYTCSKCEGVFMMGIIHNEKQNIVSIIPQCCPHCSVKFDRVQ